MATIQQRLTECRHAAESIGRDGNGSVEQTSFDEPSSFSSSNFMRGTQHRTSHSLSHIVTGSVVYKTCIEIVASALPLVLWLLLLNMHCPVAYRMKFCAVSRNTERLRFPEMTYE